MSVLSLRDLRITYSTQGGPVPAVRGVNLEVGTVERPANEAGCIQTYPVRVENGIIVLGLPLAEAACAGASAKAGPKGQAA